MTFLSSKKPPFDEKTSSNDKTWSLLRKRRLKKIFRNFDQNHGLTTLKICKFFNFSYLVFLSFKKAPFEKKISANDKTNASFTEK